jgi:hypothetical protein
MKTTQIAVFGQNTPGNFGRICRALADAGVTLLGHSITSDADSGIMRLVVDKVEAARAALSAQGYGFSECEVILVEVPDEVGAAAKLGETLAANGVNIEGGWASGSSAGGAVRLILRVNDSDKALSVVSEVYG